jgi:hypothetical protein
MQSLRNFAADSLYAVGKGAVTLADRLRAAAGQR